MGKRLKRYGITKLNKENFVILIVTAVALNLAVTSIVAFNPHREYTPSTGSDNQPYNPSMTVLSVGECYTCEDPGLDPGDNTSYIKVVSMDGANKYFVERVQVRMSWGPSIDEIHNFTTGDRVYISITEKEYFVKWSYVMDLMSDKLGGSLNEK